MTTEFAADPITLKRYVKASVGLHVFLLLALTLQAYFFLETPVQFEQAIRVDIVGLPDKPQEAPAVLPSPKENVMPPKEAPPAKVEPPVAKNKLPTRTVDPEAIKLEHTKNDSKSKEKKAMEKLKQMQALEEIQKDIEQENRRKQLQNAPKPKFAGNIISPGTELTGVNKLQADTYIDKVHKHMIEHWALPAYLRNRGLKSIVQVKFDESGNILEKQILKSSS